MRTATIVEGHAGEGSLRPTVHPLARLRVPDVHHVAVVDLVGPVCDEVCVEGSVFSSGSSTSLEVVKSRKEQR